MDMMEECICIEWDGRGRSVCGVQCPMHPVDGNCPTCKRGTHANQLCFECECKEVQAAKTFVQKQLEKALHHTTEAMQAYRALLNEKCNEDQSFEWSTAKRHVWVGLEKETQRNREWLIDRLSDYRKLPEYVSGP